MLSPSAAAQDGPKEQPTRGKDAPANDASHEDAPADHAPPTDAPPSDDAPSNDAEASGAAGGHAPGNTPSNGQNPAANSPDASSPAPAAAEGAATPSEPADESAPELSSAPTPAPTSGTESLEDIVVTGYRKSLDAALSRKQRATAQVDAIVADDIADFPDLNLADALQRMPGVAITRDSGEGARLTVRGLSGQYTRTRINGMDTRVAIGDNTTRSFDFNMFASELFNSVIVNKTATPELGEGSLGAVIDLNTGHAFNYKPGFTVVASAQGNYNDLSQTVRPRVAGLVSYRDPKGVWGATASVAYSKTRNDEVVSDTVRWERATFRSVNGVVCADNPTDVGCTEVANAFGPRIPRYLQRVNVSERLGLTAGFQLKPTAKTELRLDGLFATYNQERHDKSLEVLLRSNQNTQDITGYTIQPFPDRFGLPNSSLSSFSLDNAWVRSENFLRLTETRFYQATLAIDHEFSKRVYVKALAGRSQSRGYIPHMTTMMYDAKGYNGFSADYRQSAYLPTLAYDGANVADGTNFFLTELRDQVNTTTNTFDTGEAKLFWEVIDPLRLSTGVAVKRMTHDTKQQNRDGTVCGLMLFNCDTNADGMNDVIGAPGQADLTEITNYNGPVGAGSTTRWATPSIDAWNRALGYYNVPLRDDLSRRRKVEEVTLNTYLQADGEIPLGLGDMRLLYNAGVQYVQTRQKSGGYVSNDFIEVKRPTYHDVLPSANAALWLTNEWVLRAAVARVMSRPALADLTPGGSVDSFNYVINFRNPRLDPTRATALDVAAEWYFAKESVVSLAAFMKSIDSFPIDSTRQGTFAGTGLPTTVIAPTSPASMNLEGTCGNPQGCWEIRELGNGPGATIRGLELGFQSPFSSFFKHLPPVIRGMGFIGNFTLVNSNTSYTFSGNTVSERLLGLSNTSFNATLYYEDSKFSTRVSLANRSDYLLAGPNSNGNLWEFVEASTRVDASAKYKIIDALEVSLEGLNLTNTPYYSKVDTTANRLFEYRKTGRNILLGARYTF
jgi:TonB-dependent receptor